MDVEVAALRAQMADLLANNTNMAQKLIQLETTQTTLQAQQAAANNITVTEYADIVPQFINGDSIQLDAFKVIHEFNGDKKVYRSWRTQVSKLMKQIAAHQTYPKYATARNYPCQNHRCRIRYFD